MTQRYAVPEAGLKAAKNAWWGNVPLDMPELSREIPSGGNLELAISRSLEAFIRCQSENPPTLTDEMWHQVSSDGKATTVTRENVNGLLKFIFSRMYLSPEPEISTTSCEARDKRSALRRIDIVYG